MKLEVEGLRDQARPSQLLEVTTPESKQQHIPIPIHERMEQIRTV